MTSATKQATHAMAEIQFGRLSGDRHVITVTNYFGSEDETGEQETIRVSDRKWKAAYPRTGSDAEKIESVLGWSGMGQTEHDSGFVHISFYN